MEVPTSGTKIWRLGATMVSLKDSQLAKCLSWRPCHIAPLCHHSCLPETPLIPLIYCTSQRHSSAQCHPETLSHSMAPTDSMVAHRDTLGHHDAQSPDAVEALEALEAPETAISIGDTGLTMHSTRQLSWQHVLEHLITDHSIMTLIH